MVVVITLTIVTISMRYEACGDTAALGGDYR